MAPDGFPWIVTFAGQIKRFNPNLTSTDMPGAARDIGIGPAGGVWVIGTNAVTGGFGVWEWNGSTWIIPPGGGSGQEIDVASNNQPIVDNSGGNIFAWNPSGQWSGFTGLATDIAVGAKPRTGGGINRAAAAGTAPWLRRRPALLQRRPGCSRVGAGFAGGAAFRVPSTRARGCWRRGARARWQLAGICLLVIDLGVESGQDRVYGLADY